MTREEYNRTLRYMEHIRMASYEAETEVEARRLRFEYVALSHSIEPFVTGAEQFSQTLLSAGESR